MNKDKSYSEAVAIGKQNAKSKMHTLKELQPKGYYQFPSREIIQPPYKQQRQLYYGVIAYCASEKKWLLVKNQYTAAFCQIIRGDYRNADLPKIVMMLRWEEWEKILYLSDHTFYFDEMYFTLFPFPSTEDLVYAKERFFSNGFEFKKITVSKESLEKNQENWRFPSGIRRNKEKPQEAAIRNYKLCTQCSIQKSDILFLGKEPFCEYKLTLTSKEEHHYWIVVYPLGLPNALKFTTNNREPALDKRWFTESELKKILPKSTLELLGRCKIFLKKNL